MSVQVGEPEIGCDSCGRDICRDCKELIVREGNNNHYCSGCDEAICCECNINGYDMPLDEHDPADHELDDGMDGEEW